MRKPLHLWQDRRGAAAAEMALVAPLLLLLMFGAFEMGNYFLSEHALVKSVRDGARYAARRSFADYDGCAVGGDIEAMTRRLTRTGQLTLAGEPGRLRDWDEADEASTITVSVACDTSGDYTGIYEDSADGAPAVTVEAIVPYASLFGLVGIDTGISLYARSEAAVAGV